ncbi:pathogenesis-related protein PRMS-like [Planoprotostelium fungivorum]|uniref:Pathogenesis-related protein PRMS-like n=1 Tax=Planoprotostelium fungivorum TaxID=1890364 RepID=A0A2P6NQU3_9EUKA|nr:pathogenesis-related protein PRMS-like [Planoprotostelium fungivorum]
MFILCRTIVKEERREYSELPFKDTWLSAHNAFRAKYSVAPLTWNAEGAALAQSWADNCDFKHGGAEGYGQNIWMSSGGGTCNLNDIEDSVTSWTAGELPDWTCGKDMWSDDGCNGGWANCGHLTQVLWQDTTSVGCACGTTCKLVVCNYNPAGNIVGENPIPAVRSSSTSSSLILDVE